ncbi:MAG TPA: outer membrane protein transport protein [Noviherbaspirillum sp.]|nr:outer membrane protein transport protein [Noviherbaspirillum sp.]
MKRVRFDVISLRLALAASTVALVLPAPSRAGGFALNEMSAASLGNAHAGGAAAAEDLSTIYFNPAGLTRLPGRRIMVSGSALRPSAEFENRGSVSAAGPLTGGNGGDAGSWALVPALYYAMDLSPDLRFGLGLQVPFGLTTEYDAGWVGRYQALKSDLITADINPVLAYRVNDAVSVGGGISAQYINVELSRAIDFGSVCVGVAGLPTCGAIGFLPQARDGSVTVKGNDWGYGFNLGALFAPDARTRFGVAYRSKVSHELSGSANFTKPAGLPAPIAASPTFTDTGARASVDLPDSLSLSAHVDLDPKWSVMADLTWTHWSRFKELRIRFDNGAADSVTPEEWRNTWRLGVAANYRYNDLWKLRGGIAYDQSPVQAEFRTPRIPDNDRIWLAFGAQYKPSRQDSWDFGYAHLFVHDSSINKAEPPVGGTLIGNYNNDVNILSVQYSRAF